MSMSISYTSAKLLNQAQWSLDSARRGLRFAKMWKNEAAIAEAEAKIEAAEQRLNDLLN